MKGLLKVISSGIYIMNIYIVCYKRIEIRYCILEPFLYIFTCISILYIYDREVQLSGGQLLEAKKQIDCLRDGAYYFVLKYADLCELQQYY